MRNRFDAQLELLNREMIEMAALCEEAISLASRSLKEGEAVASQLMPLDEEIDRREHRIESLCMLLLLQQQPVARDLRQISAALKMITDLERIGDQAEDIGRIVLSLDGRAPGDSQMICDMAAAASSMVTKSVDAFVRQDVALTEQVIADDDVVDGYFMEIKKVILADLIRDPTDGEFLLNLFLIAKYFERIGDHAVNLGEWVVFVATGLHKGKPL